MPDHITTPGDDPRFAVAAPGRDFRNRRSDEVERERRDEIMAFLAGEGIPTRWDPDPKGSWAAHEERCRQLKRAIALAQDGEVVKIPSGMTDMFC